jgi:hypothetical protein
VGLYSGQRSRVKAQRSNETISNTTIGYFEVVQSTKV